MISSGYKKLSVLALLAVSGWLAVPASVWAGLDEGMVAIQRQDYSTAFAEFKPLAEQGMPEAQVNLGNLYMKGLGVPQDYVEARHWYEQAARQGDATAESKLGVLHFYGLGTEMDTAEAGRWFRNAADRGEASAQAVLGSLYASGNGVEKDNAQAYFWYTLAAEQGNQNAVDGKNSLIDEMAPGEMALALDRLAEWQKQKEAAQELLLDKKPEAKKTQAKKKSKATPKKTKGKHKSSSR
ncbi:tetratricopeptide repeat protein [Methylocaldum sp.]|uniref:tetratricopeptide repeat protein n=1 Tax=Methylocaldum sp. TaxID=1969727 RepID=UPI002D2BA8DC|nr:tetratricopeptide repeat protein [Methylocaldum sp.]HYE36994.1 tetratricopeptide repeat protein [Methylocaldum sp.]